METVKIRNHDMYWDIAADIHFPPNFDKSKNIRLSSAHTLSEAARIKPQATSMVLLLPRRASLSSLSMRASRVPAAVSRVSSKTQHCAWRTFAMWPIIW